MKTAAVVSGMAAVLALGGCGGERESAGMSVDLERDLQLATAAQRPRTAVVSAIEGGPTGAPSGEAVGRRDAVPTPRRTPRPASSAPVTETVSPESVSEAEAPAVVTMEQVEPTPSPDPSPEASVPAPPDLSTEAVVAAGPSARGDENAGRDGGSGSGSGRRGGGWGGIIGAVIRGTSAGVDHCEEHDRRRNGGRIGTRVGGTGGMIGTVIGEAIDRGRAPVGMPQRWPRY
jgi:hypothetical protein